jgi:DNA-binding transcriptional regulator YhcF (GntR family)
MKPQSFQPQIQKDSATPIQEQLVTQFSIAIASGAIPSGSKLPSVRGLASKLGIHYNTVSQVYQTLSQNNLIESRRGSGVYVKPFINKPFINKPFPEKTETSDALSSSEESTLFRLTQRFILDAVALGAKEHELSQAVSLGWAHYHQQGQKPWLFVDAHADIIPVFLTEWNRFGNIAVEGKTLEELDPETLQHYQGFLVSRYHHQALLDAIQDQCHEPLTPFFPVQLFDIGSPQAELNLLATLPQGSLVVVVSQSQTMLNICETLLSPLSADHLLVRCILWQDGWPEVKRTCTHASVVLSDLTCLDTLKQNLTKPVRAIQLVPESAFELIQTRS